MTLLLLACAGEPDDTSADSTPAPDDTQDTEVLVDTGPPDGARDILLITEHSASLADDHADLKNQAPDVLASLGEGDHLGLVTDGANGCAISGVLTRDSDPQALRNALNGQEGPLSGNLLEASQRALAQTIGGCNTGLGRDGAELLILLLSDQSGQQHDLAGIAEHDPTIWWLGEGDCSSGPYADAVSATGGQVVCPWRPDGLLTALTD